jgi:nitrite reductase/ring-hydroxylating ferredoxin subunit
LCAGSHAPAAPFGLKRPPPHEEEDTMEKQEQIRLLKLLMQRLDDDENVDAGALLHNPANVYTSPELAEREWEHLFRTHPQVIGMSPDLPAPGTFITRNDFGVPVLATRDKSGQLRAFVNVCRHRGVMLESEPEGKRSRFSCPFHAWTYSNQGDLVTIPKEEHFGKIDKACHGLVPLPAVERYGFLWVHPDPQGALDVDTLLGGLAAEFDSWGFAGMEQIGSDTYDMKLNWKLAMDTFGETYHFKTLHRDTLAERFYGNVQCYDTFERNHRMILCMKAIDQLRDQPESSWHISMGSLPEARERFGEQIEEITRNFAVVIRDEDYAVAARSQIGAESGLIDHMVFGRNEPALHHYHSTYRRALGMEPLERIPG